MNFQFYAFSGKSVNCYGLSVVCQNLWQRGHTCLAYSTDSTDQVLLSCYWPEQIFDILRFRYRGVNKSRRFIVGGNTATANPSVFLEHVDGVFLGDGEDWDGNTLHDNVVTKDTDAPKNKAVAARLNPVPYVDVQSATRSFIEISRGCRNRCFFCQYGWLKKYKEASLSDVADAVGSAKTKTIRLFAADRFQHSQYVGIREMMDRRGKCDSGSDASLRYLLKHKEYFGYTNKIRTGIEGMSERLRRAVNKPISDDQIVESVVLAQEHRIKVIDWYMIYGLPGEGLDDMEKFVALLARIDKELSGPLNIAVHWNAFTPSAQTPLQWAPPAHNYSFRRELLERTGVAHRLPKLTVYHKPLLTSRETVAKRTLATRAGIGFEKLLFTIAKSPRVFSKSFDGIFNRAFELSGVDLLSEWPSDEPLPWDRYVVYDRERMLRIWRRYKERMGV